MSKRGSGDSDPRECGKLSSALQRFLLDQSPPRRLDLYRTLPDSILYLAVERVPEGLKSGWQVAETELEISFLSGNGPSGGPVIMAFASPDEIEAAVPGFKCLGQPAREILLRSCEDDFEGVVLNPSGQWIFVPRTHIEALLEIGETVLERRMAYGCMYRDLELFPQAESEFREVVNADPDDGEALLNLAGALQAQGKNREAIEVLDLLLAEEPRAVMALLCKGLCRLELRQFVEAKEILRHVIHLDPWNVPAYWKLGCILEHERDFEGAIAHYRRGLRCSPENPELLAALGACFAAKGDFKEARSTLMDAVAADPDSGAAYYNLARLCATTNQAAEAIGHLEQACQLDGLYCVKAPEDPCFVKLKENPRFRELTSQQLLM